MSRIHDALKKAAEERSSRGVAGSAPDLVDVAEELHRPARPRDNPQTTMASGLRQLDSQLFLRFEELLKRCSHPTWNPDPRMNVFKDQDNKKNGAESFRTLGSRLHQIAGTRTLKRILVTSSVPAEGKTFVATNLALSIIRQPNRRVLLIDADLRASRLHLPFGAPATPGLTEYLRGEADEYSVIQCGTDEKLCLISGGSEVANSSELLLSERMKHLLDLVTPMFDFVILDSPPAIPVHDSNLLADFCDGTLFVVRAGATDFEVVTRAAAGFEGKNLLGVVLNGVGHEAAYGQYYAGSYGNSD
jgi:capsular exopolysaccharide synthesis family protein